MGDLGLPYIASKRPVWDTFPGAWYTIGIDVIMPNGRTLQVASCHHYRDQWAQAFDLSYEAEDRTTKFCHQTQSFGVKLFFDDRMIFSAFLKFFELSCLLVKK